MDTFRAEIVLYVIQYLNVTDSCCLAQTSKRLNYLVHQFRRVRGPEISINVSDNDLSVEPGITGSDSLLQLYQATLDKLQTKPNLAVIFSKGRFMHEPNWDGIIPSDIPILQTWTWEKNIQSNVDGNVKCSSHNGLMLLSIPNTQIKPFAVHGTEHQTNDQYIDELFLNQLEPQQSDFWKIVIVFGSMHAYMDPAPFRSFVHSMHDRCPHAAIVGGIGSHVMLTSSGDGWGGYGTFVGVALGGENVPIQVRSVISRAIRTVQDHEVDAIASMKDLEQQLSQMSTTVGANKREEILAALMFSSKYRGPTVPNEPMVPFLPDEAMDPFLPDEPMALFVPDEPMADAMRFEQTFNRIIGNGATKHISCLGFYSDGEIGLSSGMTTGGQDVTIQRDTVAILNPVVVFAVFVATPMIPPVGVEVDDTQANWDAYFEQSHT